MVLRIALVQMRCEKADITANLRVTRDIIEAAKSRNIDFVCFPEMSVSGYADPTRYPQACLTLDGPEVTELLETTRDFHGIVLAGIIEQNPTGKPYITQLVLRQGRMLGYYRKVSIKEEETLWFDPGSEIPVFDSGDLTYGIAICADIGNESVFSSCSAQGAKVIFELAAPGLYGSQETRDWKSGFEWWRGECRTRLSSYSRKYGVWIPVATQAGRTIDEDFPGGGYIFAPGGDCVFATSDWSEGVEYLSIDLDSGEVAQL